MFQRLPNRLFQDLFGVGIVYAEIAAGCFFDSACYDLGNVLLCLFASSLVTDASHDGNIVGTAKGGVAVAIKKEFDLNVRYVGVGEGKEDLLVFDAQDYSANII